MEYKPTEFPTKAAILSDMTIAKCLHIWMENYGNNIGVIKESPDIREMDTAGGPALVVGAGPSIDKYNHLDVLAKSNFKRTIISTDRMLIPLLEKGIIPQYVVSVDAYAECLRYFDHPLVREHADKITGIFMTFVHPATIKSFSGKKYFFHQAMDDVSKPDSITRAIYFIARKTIVPCCGDVGSTAWKVAHGLDCNPIAMIGMDYSESRLTELFDYYQMINNVPKDKITKKRNCVLLKMESGPPLKAFRKDYNPDFKNVAWTGMVWDGCWQTFKHWISLVKKEKGVITINCTGGGIIHSSDVVGMKFDDFLKKHGGN